MNDAQRKAMERAIMHMDPYKNFGNIEAAIAALRAQLDAPAEKGEPVAIFVCGQLTQTAHGLEQDDFDIEWQNGVAEQFNAANPGKRFPLYSAPPAAAQIADEAIEKCAKVCEEWPSSTWLANELRALKSSTTPTEGEKG